MKRAIIIAAITAALALSASAQTVTTKFDKFKNRTNLATALTATGNVTLEGKEVRALVRKMDMLVAFSCEGQVDSCAPARIELLFVASTASWCFSGRKEVNLLIDGKPLAAGTSDHDGTVNGGSDLTEYMDTNITPDVLIAMAKAKTIEVQIGFLEFSLTGENLAALREIGAHLSAAVK